MTAIVLVVLLAVAVGVLLGWLRWGYRAGMHELGRDLRRTAAATKDRPTRQRLARDERLGLAVGRRNERTRSSS